MNQMSRKHGRAALSAAITFALAATAFVPASAFAQQAATPSETPSATTLDSVQVTG